MHVMISVRFLYFIWQGIIWLSLATIAEVPPVVR